MRHGSNGSGITWLGGADPASPFLHYLDGDRIRYGIVSAGPYPATGPGELYRRMRPVLHHDPVPSKRTGPLFSRTLVSAVGMSALGLKQKYCPRCSESALPPKADVDVTSAKGQKATSVAPLLSDTREDSG